MAEVGVLNLTIKDNSEKAGQGLSSLAGALSAVKTALTGFNLSPVGQQVNQLAKTIQEARGTSTIIKNLGTMFNSINQFSKIKSFTIDTDKIRSMAENMLKLADAKDRVDEATKSGAGVSDWRSGMMGISDATKEAVAEVKNQTEELGRTMTNFQQLTGKRLNIQLFGGSGTGDQSGIFNAKSQIQYKTTESQINQQTEALSNVQSQIQHTTEAQIKLNDAGRAYAGTVTIFDEAEKTYKQMHVDLSMTTESLRKAIDWTQVPASGKNGVFASVAEEVSYLKQKIDDEIVSQQQWLSINEAATKQLSYGGGSKSVKELQFDKKYSEEGYYAALEAEQKYKDALTDLSGYMNEYASNAKKVIQENNAQAESMQKVANATNSANDAMAKTAGAVQSAMGGAPAMAMPEKVQRTPWTAEDVSNLVNYYSQLQLLEMKMRGMQDALARDIEANKLDTQQIADRTIAIQNLRDKIEELKRKQDEAAESSSGLSGAWSSLKGAMTRMFPTLTGLMKRFKSMATMRALRYVIRQIAAGFSEGVQNVYHYSKAVGTSLAPAMDQAATALQQMKNSIGAAVAPVIQALVPVLQTVVNWLITGINYLNQFFALLNGQTTWTRALPEAAEAFEKNTKAAKGSSKAMKDLLADWDELNIIQSESGGGGGGSVTSAAEDYLNMFEEVGKYENWIKDLVDNIKGQFGDIWGLVKRIGIAVLGWKVSSAFAGILGTIGMLIGAGAIIDIVFNITQLLDNQYFKTKDIGWVIADVLQTAIGAYLANKVVKNVIGKGAGKVTAGITLAVSAVADIIALAGATDVEALSTEGIITSIKSGLKLGAGFYLLENFAGVHGMKAFAGAGEIASIGIGAAIGIKAIATYADTGELTLDRIKELLTGVTIAGVGVTLFELASGAGIAAAVTSGGVVALGLGLVFAAAIGVVAVARLLDQDDSIQWGDYNATQTEIETWAKEQAFKANISANLTLLNNTVDILPEERKKIEEDAAALIPTLQVIKYGLATEETYTKLKEELFGTDGNGGVIGRVKTYAEEQKTLIQTSFTFAPIVDEKGVVDKDATAEFLKAGTAGWGEVEAYMGRIGTQLADALKGNTINGIKTFDDELILELTNKLSNVQRALSQSQISSGALGGMMTGLSGLTKESFSNAVNVFDDYKNQLRDKYSAMLQEELTSFRSLSAFYAERGEEGDAELAKYYADQADRLVENWDKRLEYAIWDMAEPGREMFRKAILKMLDFEVTNDDITSALTDSGYANYDMGNFIASMFDTKGNINETAGERFDKYLQDILKTVFPKNYDVIKQLMDSGALNYADLIPKEMISGIADGFLGEHPELTQAWNDFINGFYTEIQLENPATEIEHDIVMTENVTTESEYETTGMGVEDNPAVAEARETIAGIEGIVAEANSGTTLALDDMTFDTTDVQTSANNAAWAIENMASRVRAAFESLDGLGFTFSAGNAEAVLEKMHAAIHVSVPAAASGAVFKSGDIFSANENGRAELIGSYGNKTAVMNNDQVVGAVTNGVAQANSGVESRLSTIEGLLTRILQKDFVAKAVPSSAWGGFNSMSNREYEKVTG